MQKNMKLEKDLDEVQHLFLSDKEDLALRKIHKIIQKYRTYYLPYNYRGIIYLASKNFDLALADFKKTVSINPNFLEGYCNLGNAYQAMNQYEKSIAAYQNALKIDTGNFQVKLNIGMLYFKQGLYHKAVEVYQSVLDTNDQIEYAHHLIAEAYAQNSKHIESHLHHEKALKINPNNWLNYFFIGRDYLWSGEKNRAIEYIKKALDINPKHSESLFALTKLKVIQSDSLISHQIQLLLKKNISFLDKAYLNFSMAKIYEDQKDYDKSFNYLVLGNECMKKNNQFNFMQYRTEIMIGMQLFDTKVKKINFSENNLQKNIHPIFILGMPRSGTSLIEQILSNHPSIFGAGELDTIERSMNNLIKEKNLNQNIIEDYIYRLRKDYFERLSYITEKPYVIDKLPLNFFWVGFIKKAFPNAKIIHTHRDPMANSFSIFKTLFSDGILNFSYDQDDIINFYNMYKKIMKVWHQEYPGEILDVSYENFVMNSSYEVKKIFDYLELSYSTDYLNLKNNHRSIMTASDLQVRDKIYKDSSLGWINFQPFLKKFEKAFS